MRVLTEYSDNKARVFIPDNATEIGTYAFEHCTSLISIVIPDCVTKIGSSAFDGCTGLTSVNIPDSVTEIGSSAFRGCTGLVSVSLPHSVTKIKAWVFNDCISLTSVIIPDSVTELDHAAFRGCSGLTSIVIPDSVTKIETSTFLDCPNLTVICSEGSYASRYCEENTIHFIYDYQYEAFHGMFPPGYKKLASPFLADEENPFIFISYSHKDRDEVLGIIKTLYESGWKIWYDEGLTIGDKYDETLETHVQNCSAFLLFVTKNSLNSLYCRENEIPWAIRYGKPIIRCVLNEGVEYPIQENAVAATVLPSEAESALEKIEGLSKGEKRVAAGISVVVNPGDRNEEDNEVNEDGFAYCLYADQNTAVIKAIQLEAKNSGCSLYDASEEGEDDEKLQNSACLVVFLDKAFLADEHLTDILISEYQAGKDLAVCMIENIEDTDLPPELIGLHRMQWLNFAFGISNDMTTKLCRHLQKRGCRDTAVLPGFEYEKDEGIIIKKYTGFDPNPRIKSEYGGVPVIEISYTAFCNNTRIKTVMLPEGITEIAGSAFIGCMNLTSVTIPDSVTRIGQWAFQDCTSLASIVIPDSVMEIGKCSFRKCTSLTSVVLPDGAAKISDSAFEGCTSLTSISLPDRITAISGSVFCGCKNLISIVIPDSVKEIGESAFKGCTGLTSISLPDRVNIIGESAFKNCTGLTSISLPDCVRIIGDSAFEGCTSLTSIDIPCKAIKMGGFKGCTGLTSFIIPDFVTTIDIETFKGCTGLTSIIIPDSVRTIDSYAFDGCTGLTSIIISDNVTKIGYNAFANCPNLTVTCSPDSETWNYCKTNGIRVSGSK